MIYLAFPDESCQGWEVQVWSSVKPNIILEMAVLSKPSHKILFLSTFCYSYLFFWVTSFLLEILWKVDSEILHIAHVCFATVSDRMSLSSRFWFTICQLNSIDYFRNHIFGFARITFTMEFEFFFGRKGQKLFFLPVASIAILVILHRKNANFIEKYHCRVRFYFTE